MTRFVHAFAAIAIVTAPTYSPAQTRAPAPGNIPAARVAAGTAGLGSNSVAVLAASGDTVWLSAELTVSRLAGTGTSQFNWITYNVPRDVQVAAEQAITAFAVSGSRLAVATAYATDTDEGSFGVGNGLLLSDDGGESWVHYGMTELFLDRQGMTIPGGDAQCFGVWFQQDTLWAAFTSEYVVATRDWGTTWARYRPDSTNNPQPNPIVDDPDNQHRYRHLNYRAYDGASTDGTLWVSTNAGVNRSDDNGVTWTNFDAGDDGLTGDFVPAVRVNPANGTVWAATQSTGISESQVKDSNLDYFPDGLFNELDYDLDRDGKLDEPGKDGISWSGDGGTTWQTYLPQDDPALERTFRAWNFAFNGDTTWVAGSYSSSDALLMSPDAGQSWQVVPIVTEGTLVVSQAGTGDVAYVNGVLWVATGRGLVRSDDEGTSWDFVLRYPQADPLQGGSVENPNGERSWLKTYAFPSPSGPLLGNPPSIVFALSSPSDVTIRIYDAGSGLVRRIERSGLGTGNHAITWDGRNERDYPVANGVYLYEVTTDDGHSATGKLMVLN